MGKKGRQRDRPLSPRVLWILVYFALFPYLVYLGVWGCVCLISWGSHVDFGCVGFFDLW